MTNLGPAAAPTETTGHFSRDHQSHDDPIYVQSPSLPALLRPQRRLIADRELTQISPPKKQRTSNGPVRRKPRKHIHSAGTACHIDAVAVTVRRLQHPAVSENTSTGRFPVIIGNVFITLPLDGRRHRPGTPLLARTSREHVLDSLLLLGGR